MHTHPPCLQVTRPSLALSLLPSLFCRQLGASVVWARQHSGLPHRPRASAHCCADTALTHGEAHHVFISPSISAALNPSLFSFSPQPSPPVVSTTALPGFPPSPSLAALLPTCDLSLLHYGQPLALQTLLCHPGHGHRAAVTHCTAPHSAFPGQAPLLPSDSHRLQLPDTHSHAPQPTPTPRAGDSAPHRPLLSAASLGESLHPSHGCPNPTPEAIPMIASKNKRTERIKEPSESTKESKVTGKSPPGDGGSQLLGHNRITWGALLNLHLRPPRDPDVGLGWGARIRSRDLNQHKDRVKCGEKCGS